MATNDQPKETRPRLVTRNDWIGCSAVAVLITLGDAQKYQGGGVATLLGRFTGSLAVVVVIWIVGRGIVRWFVKRIA
jgi:hypothetical protein